MTEDVEKAAAGAPLPIYYEVQAAMGEIRCLIKEGLTEGDVPAVLVANLPKTPKKGTRVRLDDWRAYQIDAIYDKGWQWAIVADCTLNTNLDEEEASDD